MNTTRDDSSSRHVTRFMLWSVIGLGILAIFALSPVRNPWGDMSLTIPTARSILFEQDLALNEFAESPLLNHYAAINLDGRVLNYFPWTPALFALPVVGINDVIAKLGSGDSSYLLVTWASVWDLERWTGSLVMALSAIVAAELIYTRSGQLSRKRRLIFALGGSLLFSLGTSAWSVASRSTWQHGPSILLGLLALLTASRLHDHGERCKGNAFWLGAIAAAAYTVRPTNALLLVVFAVWIVRLHRQLTIWYVLGSFVTLAGWITINLLSGHGAIPAYYVAGRLSFHGQFPEAVVANLVSTGRGLFVFSPFLIFAIRGALVSSRQGKGDPTEYASSAIVVGILAGSSLFPHWWAGHSFGPRFMAETLPYFLVLMIPGVLDLVENRSAESHRNPLLLKYKRISFALLSVLSIGIHAQGALLEEPACWNRAPTDVDIDPSRIWSLSDAQVTSGLRSLLGSTPRTIDDSECFAGW